MTTLTPSCIILSNIDSNSGTFTNPQTQPANDFYCRFLSPIYLKENSRVALKSIQFESANEIVIDDSCNELELYLNGGGAPTFGVPYPGNMTNTITLVQGTYTIETLCEHISNQVMAAFALLNIDEHFGFRCYFAAKGYIWFEFVRDESGDYGLPLEIQIWTNQNALADILGLAINSNGLGSQLHELSGATGPVHNIVCDYQPFLNRTLNGTSSCVLVELQNLRIKSMNSYIRNNVNIMAKVPIYSVPIEPYVQYEPAETIYFKTQETTLTELHIRLLNIDMTLHKTTNQKPTILVLEILPIA